jgi:antitoxin component of RelBE/YafQ-DinJ toxin-antitoxin module
MRMEENKNNKMVNFLIEDELWEKFKIISKNSGLTASSALRRFIIRKVKEYEKKQKED